MSDGEGGEKDGEDAPVTPELRWRRFAASRLVLSALRRCFQSDRSGFVDKARFDLLLPAVVSQLECGSDLSGAGPASADVSAATASQGAAVTEVALCRLQAEELVGPCLAQLASASGKDALWKALANAVLMRTRSGRAGVRVAALVSLRQCFEVVGEEFLALLPECLPFLSELLEVRKCFSVLRLKICGCVASCCGCRQSCCFAFVGSFCWPVRFSCVSYVSNIVGCARRGIPRTSCVENTTLAPLFTLHWQTRRMISPN